MCFPDFLRGKKDHDSERRKAMSEAQSRDDDAAARRKEQKRFLRPALRATHGF